MKAFAQSICKDSIAGNLKKMIEKRSKDGNPVPKWFVKLIDNQIGRGWIHCYGHLLRLDYEDLKKVIYDRIFENLILSMIF